MTSTPKQHHLVLVHGLNNRHRWGSGFLGRCLDHWGSGRVFVLYLNSPNDLSYGSLGGRNITCLGRDDYRAGCGSVSEQAGFMEEKINILRDNGLGPRFYIIAHSMGGLVSRYYIHKHPGAVAGLVTLGTPHHGSPLANAYSWLGPLFGIAGALYNLTPEWAKGFNLQYPVAASPLYGGGRIYTVRGLAKGWPWEWGWGGEIFLGWHHLRWLYGTSSDGLVPGYSSITDGAGHLADLPGCDHLKLVRSPEVADICARALI